MINNSKFKIQDSRLILKTAVGVVAKTTKVLKMREKIAKYTAAVAIRYEEDRFCDFLAQIRRISHLQQTPTAVFRIMLVLLLFTALAGCAAPKKKISQETNDYFAILNQMTRSRKVIENMDTKLIVSATYRSRLLREAYAEEYAKRYRMDNGQKEKLKKAELDLFDKYNEFFIALYTPEDRWNDLDQPATIWTIYLEDKNGSRLSPLSIRKVEMNSPLFREFYPHVDLWSMGYIVRFPRYLISGDKPFPADDEEYFRLIVTGVVGNAVLEWQK